MAAWERGQAVPLAARGRPAGDAVVTPEQLDEAFSLERALRHIGVASSTPWRRSRGDRPVDLPLMHSGKVRDVYDAGDGPPADGGLRPHLRLRRGDGRAHPRQGPGAHRHDRLLVRAAGRRGAEPPGVHSTRRPARPAARTPELAGRAMLVRRGRDAAHRVHRAGLPVGLGVEGVPATGHHARRAAAGRAAGVRPAARAACSRRRPRPTTGHDENISFDAAVDLVGADVAERARAAVPRRVPPGAPPTPPSGGSSSPTPSSSSAASTASWSLSDEVLTPDSSRFWPADAVGAGQHARRRSTSSRVRDWLEAHGLGQDARRRRRCPPRWSPPPGPATSRPTSGSPAARSPTGTAQRDDGVTFAVARRGAPAARHRRPAGRHHRAVAARARLRRRRRGVRVGKAIRFTSTPPTRPRPRPRSRSCASGSSPTR